MKQAERSNLIGLVAVLAVLFALSLGWFLTTNARVGMSGWNLISSGLLIAVPLALLFGSIGVLVVAIRQHRDQGHVSGRLAKWIYWTPRIAGIVIAMFVAMFALDVFGLGGTVWQQIGAFLIHALPAILMGVVVVIAWRWEWVGAAAFLLAALFFMRVLLGNPEGALGMLLLFSGPMLVIAVAFWLNWQWRKEIRLLLQ